jgi:hypothetical protein
MFRSCESLEKAPALPATQLAIGCYEEMFRFCKNLNYIKALFLNNDFVKNRYLKNWVEHVAEYGTFVMNKNYIGSDEYDYYDIPQGIP